MSVLCLSTNRFNIIFKSIVGNKSLQLSDRHRLAFDSSDAFSLTLGLLRADTSADRRKGAGLSDHLVCFLNITFLDFMDESWNIDGYRTSLDTFCILAVQASRRLVHCFFQIISKTNLVKVRCTYFRILLPYRNFL